MAESSFCAAFAMRACEEEARPVDAARHRWSSARITSGGVHVDARKQSDAQAFRARGALFG